MEEKSSEELDIKETLKGYNRWVKENWFTVIGIIIILGITWYDVATVQAQKYDLVEECNHHWRTQTKGVCGTLGEYAWVPSGMEDELNIT